MTNKDKIRYIQKRLVSVGENIKVDGILGRYTINAIYRVVRAHEYSRVDSVAGITELEDERSSKHIRKLLPILQPVFTMWLRKVKLYAKEIDPNCEVKIISGLRTFEEQDALYAQGRTKPGNIVTKAKAGTSWHNYGVAVDIGVFKNNKYLDNSKDKNDKALVTLVQMHAAKIGKEDFNLEWGGNWKRFKDKPHYHYKTGLSISQAYKAVNAGKPIL